MDNSFILPSRFSLRFNLILDNFSIKIRGATLDSFLRTKDKVFTRSLISSDFNKEILSPYLDNNLKNIWSLEDTTRTIEIRSDNPASKFFIRNNTVTGIYIFKQDMGYIQEFLKLRSKEEQLSLLKESLDFAEEYNQSNVFKNTSIGQVLAQFKEELSVLYLHEKLQNSLQPQVNSSKLKI